MRTLFHLAVKSAWNRRFTLALVLFSITLSVALLAGVERLRTDARDGFAQAVSGTDLVVGARTSPIQLMLYAVFRIGSATNNMSWSSVEKIAAMPTVAWAVPLSLGDSHRGFPVLGTTPDYFTHFRHGDDEALRFAAGSAFGDGLEHVFEAVVGAEVAARLGYRVGDRIVLSHGGAEVALAEHDDKPFTITGVLAPTGTPVDRSVHVGLAAIEAIHLDWQGGAKLPGVSIPAEYVRKFDLQPKQVTAVLVGLKTRAAVFRVQRAINNDKDEALIAVLPGVALDQLWQVMGVLEKTLLAVSAMVALASLAGLAAVLLASLNERRREMAILRSLGAGPAQVFLLLAIESLFVTAAGIVLGLLLLDGATLALGPWLRAQYGVLVQPALVTPAELPLLGLMLVAGLAASLLPGWRAYRLSLADGLTPRL